eukprot:scaffold156231_cov19-Tisochrysis_lutea.AAC.2
MLETSLLRGGPNRRQIFVLRVQYPHMRSTERWVRQAAGWTHEICDLLRRELDATHIGDIACKAFISISSQCIMFAASFPVHRSMLLLSA